MPGDASLSRSGAILECDAGDVRKLECRVNRKGDIDGDRILDVGPTVTTDTAGCHSILVQISTKADQTEGRTVEHVAASCGAAKITAARPDAKTGTRRTTAQISPFLTNRV